VKQTLPKLDRQKLSTLTALVLITFSLVRMVDLPELYLGFSLFNLLVEFSINARFIMLVLAALLTTAGADWLIRDHPLLRDKPKAPMLQHWIIPCLAAFAGGYIVTGLPTSAVTLIGMGLIALILILILATEFIAVDNKDSYYPQARFGLRALAYFLLWSAFFALRSSDLRTLFNFPLLILLVMAVAWRLLLLAFPARNPWRYSLLIAVALAQINLPLQYWPIPPLKASVILIIMAYIFIESMESFLQQQLTRAKILELGLLAALSLLLVVILL